MNFNRTLSLCFASVSLLFLVPSANAQIAAERAAEKATEMAGSTASIEAVTAIETADWSEANDIKVGFMQGCIGSESTDSDTVETKQNYCQCAFSEYSERYTPYQFLQINTLATRIGEDGPLLVNLMMGREMNNCAEKTGFELQ